MKHHKGFTLIEILVVLALMSILLGVVLVVINVGMQRSKTRQAVAKTNLTKACTAYLGCLLASPVGAAGCDTWDEVGAIQPTLPPGYTFSISASGPTVSVDGCGMSCDSNGNAVLTPETGGTCYVL